MKRYDRRRHAALQDERLTRLAQQDLYTFVRQAWPILEPDTPFKPNWHLELICEYLMAVTVGKIRRLVINVPPRYGKSLLVSVYWPLWEWLRRPSGRWLFASYSEALALAHSQARRRVLRDPWFQARWSQIRLTRDQQAKAEFHNTRRGVMAALSLGGSATGRGGHRLVIDDPHSPEQADSDVLREQAVRRFREHLATRLDDKAHDAIVVVMQRLHTDDITALCQELRYEVLSLPAYESNRRVITFPLSERKIVREPNEPLWPAREGHAELAELRHALGSYAFAAQYLQDPVPRVGGMFPRTWWNTYVDVPEGGRLIQSWDLAFKDSAGSDFVVGLVGVQVGACLYLIDRVKKRMSFTETVAAMLLMLERYPQTSAVLVESAANGEAVVDALKERISGLIAVLPKGGKIARASAVQPMIEAGQVYLPAPGVSGWTGRHAWVEDFVEVCARFPKVAHDDDVDALTQLLVWMREHNNLEPAGLLRAPEPSLRSSAIFGDRSRGLAALDATLQARRAGSRRRVGAWS